jgi:hypothetical protein
MDPVSEPTASFEFGRFRILPQRREVLADDQPMELGGRAFDVLVVLIDPAEGQAIFALMLVGARSLTPVRSRPGRTP